MSNAAKFEVPDSGDNGKTYVYSSGSDSHVLTSLAALYQPLDSDLTAIAALTTTSTGRSLLAAADAAAIRTIAGAEASGAAASAVSAHDADTSVHGIADTSALVTLTGSQTLTNKTLTTPVLTLEQGASVAPTAEGRIAWDTDDNQLRVGDGTGTAAIPKITVGTSQPSSPAVGDLWGDTN